MYSFYFESDSGFIDKISSSDFNSLQSIYLDYKADPHVVKLSSIFEDDSSENDTDVDE